MDESLKAKYVKTLTQAGYTIVSRDLARSLKHKKPFQIPVGDDLANEVLNDPVGSQASWAIRTLGQILHDLGGIKLMREVLSRVDTQPPATPVILQIWARAGIGGWTETSVGSEP